MNSKTAKAKSAENDYYVRTSCWSPPGCHPVGCGLYLHIKDGKLIDVEGDEEHPISQGRLCARCLALPEANYHKDRVLYPLKRAREDRGKDKWERITWDEAFNMIETNAKRIKADYGSESIVVFNGTGREAGMYSFPTCFASFQSPNSCFAMSGYACYGPRNAIANYILGAGYPEIDYAAYFEDRYDNPAYVLPEYIMIWGKQPLISNPDGLFGHSLIDMMKRGSKLIVVDPRVNWLATKAAYHIQLRPGTDAAVALAMLYVIINEDLYDHEFVENYCHGFEELKERVQEYPPAKVAEICWCSEKTIVEAARAFATSKPSTIGWGLALDESSNGVQAGQAILAIAGITGNLDVPGGLTLGPKHVFLGKWWSDSTMEVERDVWAKRLGADEFPGFAAVQTHCQPDVTLECLETGEPYELKMAYFCGTNFLASSAAHAPRRWYKALLEKMDFIVGQDIFMTPTTMGLADLFLPVSTFAEHNGIVMPHFGRNMHMMASMNKAIETGETKSDCEIMIEIGRRLNPKAWPYESAEEFFDYWLKGTYPFGLDGLKEMNTYQPGFTYRKYDKGMLRDDGEPGFNTPTGRIELYSTLYEQFGDDPLPYFEEPRYSPYSKPELADVYPLVFTSGARKWGSFHTEHRQIDSLRDIDKDPLVEIHPDTAAQYKIKDGDWVCIENPFGRGIQRAKVTPAIDPRVVHAQHGWWYPEQDGEAPNLYGVWKSDVNDLVPNRENGVIGFGGPFKCMICKIYRVDSLDS